MGVITDLKTRLEVLANMTDVKQVIFDDLEEINADSKNNYPLLLFRDDEDTSDNYRNSKEYPVYKIDFYLADLYYQGDTMTLAEKKDYLKELLDSVIKSIPKSDNNFELLNVSNGVTRKEQHNDDLFVRKITASIRGFHCVNKIDQ